MTIPKPTDPGRNRTGIQSAPEEWRETAREAQAGTLEAHTETGPLARVRVGLSRNVAPLGTLPAPLSLKRPEAIPADLDERGLAVLIDQLGERIAYERTGIRLYEALLCKHAAAHLGPSAPGAQDLAALRADELRHLALAVAALERLGGDPTAVTPCADSVATAATGFVQALADPRTTFTQALRIMLLAEMGDQAGWETLLATADALGLHEDAAAFRQALEKEDEHGRRLKAWLLESLRAQADGG